jgi:hypothetical protein
MSFQIVYVGGGMLDKVRSVTRLESGRLDDPYMPTKTEPYIKGRMIEIPDKFGVFQDVFKLDHDVELMTVSVAANRYAVKDNWYVYIDSQTVFDEIYTKNLPEGCYLMVAKKVPANTPITFKFHNDSGTAKSVWINYQFLE